MSLKEYWGAKDAKTNETWLSFAQRTGMDAVSIAYGQAWEERRNKASKISQTALVKN